MRSARIRRRLRLLVATLACIVAGALLHPTTAAASPQARDHGTARTVAGAPSSLTVPVTREQAVAWHLRDGAVTTRTSGGSTVVFHPGAPADQTQDFRYRVRWWGHYTVFFTRLETAKIARGAAVCAVVVKRVPTVGPYLSTLCAVISVVARYALAHGECVMVHGSGRKYPQILRYRGAYCR
jgi:hypothetical protein